MTMYLPNPTVHFAESDAVEFLELRPMAAEDHGRTMTPVERRSGATVQLGPQARIDIARWTRDYITDLVASYSGDREDVRSIIQDLHDQFTLEGALPGGA